MPMGNLSADGMVPGITMGTGGADPPARFLGLRSTPDIAQGSILATIPA